MRWRNGSDRFGVMAKSFHWGMALVVVPLWILGYVMVGPTQDLLAQYELYQLHKSFGFVVFGLGLLRLAWRLIDPPPPLPATTPGPQRLAGLASHVALYLLLLALPVTGFLMSAASPLGIPTVIFEIIPVPNPIGPSPSAYAWFQSLHDYLGKALAALLAVHVLAAFHHHWIARDTVLERMLPFSLLAIVLAMSALSGPSAAAERSYDVDPARTRVTFAVDATGFAGATGVMKVRSGQLRIDTDHPERTQVTLSLDAASIDTGLPVRDEAIRGSSFLNVAEYPDIRFATTAVYPDKGMAAMVLGELTMIGVSKPLTIETRLTAAPDGDQPIGFAGTTRLARSAWGMPAFLPLVGDEVTITFQLTAVPSP